VVGLERTITGTVVNVGSGVNVGGAETDVDVASNTGIAAAVWVKEESAVSAIRRLIESGSSVGTGVTAVGAHARINQRAVDHSINFLFGIVMKPLL
jgi:hypothetical protein